MHTKIYKQLGQILILPIKLQRSLKILICLCELLGVHENKSLVDQSLTSEFLNIKERGVEIKGFFESASVDVELDFLAGAAVGAGSWNFIEGLLEEFTAVGFVFDEEVYEEASNLFELLLVFWVVEEVAGEIDEFWGVFGWVFVKHE